MKFKATVIGLLAAIFATCIFTSYRLINEARQQTRFQYAQMRGMETLIELSDNIEWTEVNDETALPGFTTYLDSQYEKGKIYVIDRGSDGYAYLKRIINETDPCEIIDEQWHGE